MGSSDLPATEAIRLILQGLGHHEALARSIDEAIDEEALEKRTRAAEVSEAIKEHLGPGAAERAADEEAEEFKEGRWGKEEPWVVKAEYVGSLCC